MKKINRYYLVYAVFAAVLAYCVFSGNPYLNAFLICLGMLISIMAFAYIDEHENEKESAFTEKLSEIFD